MIKYDLNGIRDVSYGRVVRLIYDVVIEQKPTRDDLLDIAREVVSLAKASRPFCALTVFFWSDKQVEEGVIGKEQALASVTFAPAGIWDDASKATAGDYSGFFWRIDYNRTCEKCGKF